MKVIALIALLALTASAWDLKQVNKTHMLRVRAACHENDFQSSIQQILPGEYLNELAIHIVSDMKREELDAKLNEMSSVEFMSGYSMQGCIVDIEQDQIFSLEEPKEQDSRAVSLDEVNAGNIQPEFNVYYAWHLDRINARSGLDNNSTRHYSTTTQSDVYVIDSGIDRHHVWLSSKCASSDSEHYVAFTDTDSCGFYACDSNSHGTHCAGLVASNVYGYNTNATLHAVKVFDKTGSTTNTVVARGVNWVLSHHSASTPATISMSLGGGYSSMLNYYVRSAINHGFHVVVAAGNETSDACTKSPASENSVYTIGASDNSDARSWFSNYGNCVDLFAPGSDILSTLPNNYVGFKSGTSMATPIVAGFTSAVAASHSAFYKDPSAVQGAISSLATDNVISNSHTAKNDLLYDNYSVGAPMAYYMFSVMVLGCVLAVAAFTGPLNKKKQSAVGDMESQTYQKLI